MKLLLIEDDEWIRGSLVHFFEYNEIQVDAFETAEEAIEQIKRQTYDVIIVDYILPGMDGLKFITKVQESHPDCLKILITAHGDEKIHSEAQRVGIHEYILKPFSSASLENALARIVGESDRNEEVTQAENSK